MMRLYEFAPTRSIRARWMLQELGEEFEAVTVNLMTGDHRRPEFLKINPAGRVPTLVDGDLVITESVAIVLYLAERDPQRRFLPRDIMLRSQVYCWLLFAATELEQPLWRIARHTALYPQELRLPASVACAPGLRRNGGPSREAYEGSQACGRQRGDRYRLRHGLHTRLGKRSLVVRGVSQTHIYLERMYTRQSAPPPIAQALASVAA
jgi:glutathione S-transferase